MNRKLTFGLLATLMMSGVSFARDKATATKPVVEVYAASVAKKHIKKVSEKAAEKIEAAAPEATK